MLKTAGNCRWRLQNPLQHTICNHWIIMLDPQTHFIFKKKKKREKHTDRKYHRLVASELDCLLHSRSPHIKCIYFLNKWSISIRSFFTWGRWMAIYFSYFILPRNAFCWYYIDSNLSPMPFVMPEWCQSPLYGPSHTWVERDAGFTLIGA